MDAKILVPTWGIVIFFALYLLLGLNIPNIVITVLFIALTVLSIICLIKRPGILPKLIYLFLTIASGIFSLAYLGIIPGETIVAIAALAPFGFIFLIMVVIRIVWFIFGWACRGFGFGAGWNFADRLFGRR